MKRSEPTDISTAERRRARRVPTQSPIKLTLETRELQGSAENLSQTGVLFYSDGALRVTIEVEQDGQRLVRHGRLVRAQRIRADEMGWAVEFD